MKVLQKISNPQKGTKTTKNAKEEADTLRFSNSGYRIV